MQKFVADCEELRNWINEKMLTAKDASYDDARSLHSKWQKHQVGIYFFVLFKFRHFYSEKSKDVIV